MGINKGEVKVDNNPKSTAVIPCQCGASMVYSIKLGKLLCPYCDTTKDIIRRTSGKRTYLDEYKSGEVEINYDTYECPNCRAEINLGKFGTAIVCPFCDTANIIKTENLTGIKPDSILPFSIEKDAAIENGKKWIKKKLYAPEKLKKVFTVDNFKGIYIPSFSFDSFTKSSYEGKLGRDAERIIKKPDGTTQKETYIEWFIVRGQYDKLFEDVVVEATTQLNQKEMNNILPYDMENVQSYDYQYVSGFVAERYDQSLSDSHSIARISIDKTIRNDILSKQHYDHVDYLNIFTDYCNEKFRYILLPIWICNYNYKNKQFRYFVNGRTGKAYGKPPISPLKVAITILVALGVIAGILIYKLIKDGIV